METAEPLDGDTHGVLVYGDDRIPYAVSVNPRQRQRVKIHVHPDGRVEVETPEATAPEAVAEAVQKRARWVADHVAAARRRYEHVRARAYVSGEQVLYLGRRYVLKVRPGGRGDGSVKLRGGLLEVVTDKAEREVVRTRVRAWYRQRAAAYFAQRMEVVSASLPWRQDPVPFRLKQMRRQWGNCAEGGEITLHPFLVKAPRECIDYVLAHELCHLREHNHSDAFFRLMGRAVPGWKAVKARLDNMAEIILND